MAPMPNGIPFRIASVSNLYRTKGIDVTLRAVAAMRSRGIPAELRVAGDGPERPRLERLARRLGLEEHARFMGRVSRSEVAKLLRDSSIMCLPSSP